MKLIIVALSMCVALAAAEIKWSEDGQYRVIETGEPLKYRYVTYGAAVPAGYTLPAGHTVPAGYRISYPMPYRTLALREYEPFVYSYQQISHDE